MGVAVIDASVTLFGLIFPRVAYKHRLQMLEHFSECIRQSKSVRQEAIQINVFTAVLSGMKVRHFILLYILIIFNCVFVFCAALLSSNVYCGRRDLRKQSRISDRMMFEKRLLL